MEITFLCGEKSQHYLKDRRGFFILIENDIKRDNSKEPGGRQKGELHRQNIDKRLKKRNSYTIVFSGFPNGFSTF